MAETEFLVKEAIMDDLELDENEFDDIYGDLLSLIREYGTLAVERMFRFLEQELATGRENIE